MIASTSPCSAAARLRDRRIARKQRRRHRIDVDVRRLRTEDHRNQQLPGIPKLQFGVRIRILELQPLHHDRRPLPRPRRQPPLARLRLRLNRLLSLERTHRRQHHRTTAIPRLSVRQTSVQPQRAIASTPHSTPVATPTLRRQAQLPRQQGPTSDVHRTSHPTQHAASEELTRPERVASRGAAPPEGRAPRMRRPQNDGRPSRRPDPEAARGPRDDRTRLLSGR